MYSIGSELATYSRLEGVELARLRSEKPPQKSFPEEVSSSIIRASNLVSRLAISSAEVSREQILSWSRHKALRNLLVGKNPWLAVEGKTAKEKWLNYQKNLLFPPEILDFFEAIELGQKSAWNEALTDVLSTVHEDEPRMLAAGILTGLGVTVVQNGEQFLAAAGVAVPSAVTIGSQMVVALLGNGIRGRASETFWNVEVFKDTAGKAVADIFDQLDLPNAYRGVNWQTLTAQILEKYKRSQKNECFSANIKGLAIGLVVGNILFGNIGNAAQYGVVTAAINYALGEKYPDMIKNMITKFVQTQIDRRTKLDAARANRRVSDSPAISAYMDALAPEHLRRDQATRKNVFQDSIATLLPIVTALVSKLATQTTLQSQAFTWSVVASTVLSRSDNVMSAQDASQQGHKALSDMTSALTTVLKDSQRRPPMKEDRDPAQAEINLAHRAGDLVIKQIGIPTYQDSHGEIRTRIAFPTPSILKQGDVGLILGGVQSGKTTLLKILTGRLNGVPAESDITLGNQKIGQAPRELLREVYQLIPLENNQRFSTRETLATVVSKPNVLGDFSNDQIQDLLRVASLKQAQTQPIVQAFLSYCRQYQILQGKNGITESWFVGQNYVLSGSQQALFNLALYTCFDGETNPKIICVDDPTNTLDESTKKHWRSFVERRLPASGHRMLIVTNDTYDLGDRTGWLAMANVGTVIDLSHQRAVNFTSVEKSQELACPTTTDDEIEPEYELSEIITQLQLVTQTLTQSNAEQLIRDQTVFDLAAIELIQLLNKLKERIEKSDISSIDFQPINRLVLILANHLDKLLFSDQEKRSFQNLAVFSVYRTSDYRFSSYILFHELESLVLNYIPDQDFPAWSRFLVKYADSTYDGILKAQDELRGAALNLAQEDVLRGGLKNIYAKQKLYDLLQMPFYRWAFSLDIEVEDFLCKGLLGLVRAGFFDYKEYLIWNFLNLACNPTAADQTIGRKLFMAQPNFQLDILAAIRHRQLVSATQINT